MKASIVSNVFALLLIILALSVAEGKTLRLRGAISAQMVTSQDRHVAVAQHLLTLAKSSANGAASHFIRTETHADVPAGLQRNKKTANSTIEIRTATILHGVNETLSADPADTFAECYMTSYNAAAQVFHGNPVESLAEDMQFVVDASTITDNDDQTTFTSSLVLPSHVKATRAPRTTTTKSVVYVGKIQLGFQCRLCSDDRLQHEQDIKDDEEVLNAAGRQQRRELVYSAFRKGFFQCLKDSGKPSFAQLVKLDVRKLTTPTSTTSNSVVGDARHGVAV